MATHSSILAWRTPWTEEPGGLPSIGSHRVGHDWSDVARTHACEIMWIFLHVGDRGTLPVTPLANQPHPREEASPMLVKTSVRSDRKLSPRAACYLLQPDLLRLEDVQHPAALNLREILPEVESRVGVAKQADLGQGLPLGWACWLLLLLPFIFLWSLLAGWAPVSTALYFCILLPPGLNLLESWFISVFLIQEPWNQIKPFWRHDRDFRYGAFRIAKSQLLTPESEKVKVSVAQSCPTLCDPMDCSPPGSSVHGILQARILEWVASPFSRGSSWPKDRTQVSCMAGRYFTIWATRDQGQINALPMKTQRKPDPHRYQGRATERTASVFISWEGSARISLFFLSNKE